MSKLVKVFLILLVVAAIVGGILFFLGFFKSSGAGVFIETTPTATVFINGEQVGRTPFRQTVEPGEVVIKLVPDSFETPLAPFETKVTLTSGIETHIQREFGDSDETSSGAVISFEKVSAKETSIAIVSIPDAAEITIDGSVRGFAPYKTTSITPGDHQIIVTAPNYLERVFSVKTVEGYKLTAVVKLTPNPEAEESQEEVDLVNEELETKVEILDTSTGFLRVRSEPTTAAEEVGRVTPGEEYILLETDEDTGWYKIEYEEGAEGWISNEYAQIAEDEGSSPSPSPTPNPTG